MVIGFWCYLTIPVLSPPREFDHTSRSPGFLHGNRPVRSTAAPHSHPSTSTGRWHAPWLMAPRGGAWRLSWLLASRFRFHPGPPACTRSSTLSRASSSSSSRMPSRAPLPAPFVLTCERIANAWWSFRLGPGPNPHPRDLRGTRCRTRLSCIACFLIPTDLHAWYAIVVLAGLLGAGTWGQFMEGGGRLSRPSATSATSSPAHSPYSPALSLAPIKHGSSRPAWPPPPRSSSRSAAFAASCKDAVTASIQFAARPALSHPGLSRLPLAE